MQHPNIPYSSYSDQYTYNPQFQTPQSQFYPQFQTPQNPNPNPNPYHSSQFQFTEPNPPGHDPYYQSYPNPNPYYQSTGQSSYADVGVQNWDMGNLVQSYGGGGDTAGSYNGASIAPSSYADAGVQNWETENRVQSYGGDTAGLHDGAGGTVPQDGSQYLVPAIPTPSNWPNKKSIVQPRGPWKTTPKKIKIAQSAWCEVCKIECNTKDVLDEHKLGKKHQKNLVKLKSAALVASISATTHVNPVVPSNPIIGPSEKSKAASISATTHVNLVVPSNPIIGPSENPNKGTSGSKNKADTPQELKLELKRRKVLEGGAAASAVRTCSFCNVVCNSDAVFEYHLAGQKHGSMLKKLQQAAVAGTG